jgi:hypothetical protein
MPPNSLRHSGEQIPKNRKGNAVLDILQFIKEKAIQAWENPNDPNFAPPYGVFIGESAKKYIFDTAENMYEHFNGDPVKIFKAASLAIGILTTAFPTGSIAQVPKHSDEIAWAIDMLNHVDPVEYLLNQNNKREARDQKTSLDKQEVNILAWNLYFEARGEKDVKGKIAVLLTSLNRMVSPKYPKTAEGVVFGKAQNSWTLDIGKDGFKEKRIDGVSYRNIRALFDSIVPGKRLEEASIENIIDQCIKYLAGSDITLYQKLKEIKVTGYHKEGMIPKTIQDLKKEHLKYLSEIKSENTFKRILMIESKIKTGQAFVFGSHVFHGDVDIKEIQNYQIPSEYMETYIFWKKLQNKEK